MDFSKLTQTKDSGKRKAIIATADAVFDAGLISFERDGSMLVSDALSPSELQLLGLVGLQLKRAPNEESQSYLEFHRNHVFTP